MPSPSSSSAGLASETPATTSSTGFTICETDSPTTFSSSTPTTSTCFSFGVSYNSESAYPSVGAPMSANQQRNETGFSVCSTAATSKTEGSSFFTTATSAALSVTTALGTSSTSTATHSFPTAFQFGTSATSLQPNLSGFQFSTPTTSISSKPSGFQFGTPAAALLSKPSGFQFSTPTTSISSKPFGFQSGTFTTAVTSTVTSTLPSTGFSVIPKAPATTCENGFTTAAPSGTTIKFYPATGTDTIFGVSQSIDVRYQSITCMKEYEDKNFEELRVEDYAANRDGAGKIAVVTTGTTNYSMAFPDSTWTYGGDLVRRKFNSPVKMNVKWDIFPYLDRKRKEESESIMKLKSFNFSYAGATWNFFASIDPIKTHSQFGINVRTQSSSDEAFYCNCDIFLVIGRDSQECIKNMKCNFILPSAGSHWTVTDILTSDEIQKFLEYAEIDCIIRIKNIKAASSQTENTHSSRSSSVETQTQLPENKDEEILKSNPIYKVCQDLKQLLLSEEDSDVTIQVGDQQFKAHQSILKARSSVFAAMFHHEMKEKATGVVNAEDCEPSSFPVLLEFLYCGSTEKLSVENMFSVYTSADKYDIQDLKMKCLEFIKNSLAVETFCETVKLGLQHLETNLLKLTVDFFAGNFKKIIVTPKWQAFILENPIQGNEILIKALASDVHDL